MDEEIKKKVKALCDAHWEYVALVIRGEWSATGDGDPDNIDLKIDLREYLKVVGFHYKTAMEHGYKHGWHDAVHGGNPVACCCESPDTFKKWNEG